MCAIQAIYVNASATLRPLHLHFGHITFTGDAYALTRSGMKIVAVVVKMLYQNSRYVTSVLK
jgi:hypothetical protein